MNSIAHTTNISRQRAATSRIIARHELRGSPASAGHASGRARILHSPEQASRLRPGDILVCATLTPAWAPLFGSVAGIISETGSALSSAAITAREYGIPAVVAVSRATTRIHDGQLVTLDGVTGVVTLQS